jgi:arylsulfatase A-like enzyme
VKRLLGAVLALLASGCQREPVQVVLITIDTLRADHVGPRPDGGASLTPALDALAQDGVVYEDAVTNCVVTRCSHVSLLTGRYPWAHGVLDNSTRYAGPSLPEVLRARGFATGAVVSSLPAKDLVSGFEWKHEGFASAEEGRKSYPIKRPEQTTQVAVPFLELHARAPFFLWVHYFPPHGPYTPPESYLRGVPELPAGKTLEVSERNYESEKIPAYQALPGLTSAGDYRRRYAAHVRYADAFVGRLLQRLRETGRYERALVIVTSDHGESLGEHGFYFQHGNLAYDEQARVPLVVKWPGNVHAGERVRSPVELVDVAPTVLAAAGAGVSPEMDGRALPQAAPFSPRPRFTQSNDAALVAVYDGPWKAIVRRTEGGYTPPGHPALLLFRLADDAGEQHDLSGAEPAVAARLEAELRKRYSGAPAAPRAATPETDEALRALGYVQ